MAYNFNNNAVENAKWCGETIEVVKYCGNVVWELLKSITITGTAMAGQVLTATVVPSTANVTYQWCRNGNDISGANSSTYTLTNSDIGCSITCKASTGTKTVTSNSVDNIQRHTWVKYLSTGWQEYPNNVYVDYSIGSNMICTYIGCDAKVHNHDSGGEIATVYAYIDWPVGTNRVTGDTNSCSFNQDAYSSCYWNGSITNTSIRIGSAGNYFGRQASGSCSGYYIH